VAEPELVQSFRFEVLLTLSAAGKPPQLLGNGAFAECSGLELEADVKEYLEGGFNSGVVRRVGRVKLQPLVLKRGIMVPEGGKYMDTAFWDWLTAMVSGALPVLRCDGHIRVSNPHNTQKVAHWSFTRGLPVKLTGPALNAKTGDISIEELHIAHEGLQLEAKP
jgi:phage tail-like protein